MEALFFFRRSKPSSQRLFDFWLGDFALCEFGADETATENALDPEFELAIRTPTEFADPHRNT